MSLNSATLKLNLQKEFSRADKILLNLCALDKPSSLDDIRTLSASCGFKIPRQWNMSDILSRTKGMAIRVDGGWEITEAGIERLKTLGITTRSPAAAAATSALRSHLSKIVATETRAFAEEAIKCFEAGLYRSAIVMSWLAAVDVLYRVTLRDHLRAFNAEASRVDPRWRPAKTLDDLARMKEADFLDRISSISVIGKSVKSELSNCLSLRNGCGHPNSLKVGQNKVASHLETLLQNVFEAFSV